MSLFRITGKSIRKPYTWFFYGCKTIVWHCGKSGWERFDFWGYTFTIISLWRKMSRSLIRLCKQYIIRVIFNATDIWVHSIIDLRVFTAILYQKLLLLFVANSIAIRNHHINCLVRTNSAKHAYTLILYLTCKVAFIPLTLNKKKRMEVNYSKLTPINHRTVGMNRILYAVWGIASKKTCPGAKSRR